LLSAAAPRNLTRPRARAQVSGCAEGVVRAWCANTGACTAHARLPPAAGPLQTLACAGAGACRVAAACAGAVFLLHADLLSTTRVLHGSALPRAPLLALSCVVAHAPDDEHAPRRAGEGSSGALAALASVRAEEEELLLAGVDAAGAVWRWRGVAEGDTRLPSAARAASGGVVAATPLALLGWARATQRAEDSDSDSEEAEAGAAAAPRGAAARNAPTAAAVSAGGGEALIISPGGWAVVVTARPAPGALPAPARASGEGAFVGGRFLGAASNCIALWGASGDVQVLELPGPSALHHGRVSPRLLMRTAGGDAAAAAAWALASLERADGSRLLLRAGGERATLTCWALPAGVGVAAGVMPALAAVDLASGWACAPQQAGSDAAAEAAEEGAVTASAFAGGGALAPCWLVQGHARGGIVLRPLPPGGVLQPHLWLRGHAGAVRCLAACQACGSALLLSGGDDATVRAWAPATGEALAVLRHHVAPVLGLHLLRQAGAATAVAAATGPLTPPRPLAGGAAPALPLASADGVLLSEGADGALGLISLSAASAPTCERLLPPVEPACGRVLAAAWCESAGALLVSRAAGAAVWDTLTGVLDRCVAGAAAEELMEGLRRDALPPKVQALRGDCPVAWAPLLACEATAFLGRRGGAPDSGEAWGPLPSALSLECGEEGRALRCALMALHAWGVDARLDAQLMAECSGAAEAAGACGTPFRFAAALSGVEGSLTLLTPAGAAQHALLRSSPRFVAARSLTMAALARRLQRLGERGRSCAAALLAFYTVQLTGALSAPPPAPPALAVYAAAWQDANEYVREAARALLASAPAASVPAALRLGADASWRAVEAAAGGAAADAAACTGRLGVLVAAGAAVAALRRDEPDLLHASVLPRIVAALRTLMRDAPAPHGAAAMALLADGMSAWWAATTLSEAERAALAEDAFALCERLSASGMPGGATELMVAREAGSELLAELAAHAPTLFLTVLAGRFAGAAPDSPAHMTCFLALIRVVQTQPAVVAPHLDRVLDAVCAALAPSSAGARRTCATGAVGVVAELAAHLPHCVAHHRASGRVAVVVHAAARIAIRVYDLGAHAGLLRLLEGSANEALVDGRAADAGAALSFDADGGRLAAYHPACGALRFWVLGGAGAGSTWRGGHSRGLQPARACRVADAWGVGAPGAASGGERARARAFRLDWTLGVGGGVALSRGDNGAPMTFLPVVG
jgi:hypothetical protein